MYNCYINDTCSLATWLDMTLFDLMMEYKFKLNLLLHIFFKTTLNLHTSTWYKKERKRNEKSTKRQRKQHLNPLK